MLDIILFRCDANPVGYVCICRSHSLSICCIDEEDTPEAKILMLAGNDTWRPDTSPGPVVMCKLAAELGLTRAIKTINDDPHGALSRSPAFQVLLQLE